MPTMSASEWIKSLQSGLDGIACGVARPFQLWWTLPPSKDLKDGIDCYRTVNDGDRFDKRVHSWEWFKREQRGETEINKSSSIVRLLYERYFWNFALCS